MCALAVSVLLFTACQEQSRKESAADKTADTGEYSEASTSSDGINGERPVGSEWTDEDKEHKDLLYPGFELGTVEINGVSYRTLTADNGCVITDNGYTFLSPYKNDYSGVYTFTLTYNGISHTEILRTPIGGYTSGNFASRVPREFVNGKYAFYTRPMDDFIDTGSGGGVGFGLCDDITHAVIDEEIITSKRKYHTITEAKNGAGAVPIKTEKGWIHIAHGVRNTAAGLRYVIYAFATALDDPSKVIAEPGGFLIAPLGSERVGDVSNVVFTNGAIARDNGDVYIYYASSDTRLHVATSTVDKLIDYVFNTPKDPLRSVECVEQRCAFIEKNLKILKS